MILLEDGSLDRALIEDWFGELPDVSHVVHLGDLRAARQPDSGPGTKDILNRLFVHFQLHADNLPPELTVYFSGLSPDGDDDLFVSCPSGLATCNAQNAKIVEVAFEDFYAFYAVNRVEIQRPESSTAPIAKVPLKRLRGHYCNFGLTSRSNGEPIWLKVFETRPVINPLERVELSLNQDPTPSQFALGVYKYNFQLELGFFDEFNR